MAPNPLSFLKIENNKNLGTVQKQGYLGKAIKNQMQYFPVFLQFPMSVFISFSCYLYFTDAISEVFKIWR